ncbi:MAG: RNA polymerase sigma factor [Nitrospirae bacterium]|nr:RNA polymerase sigma factor [Nitrospirota bacterium]
MAYISDEEIVRRLKAGDDDAFNELIERHKKMGFSLAYNMLGSIEDAEDISQEAFAIAYTEIGKFRQESSFKTWLYRIIINLCRKHYRKNKLMSFIPLYFHNKEGEEQEMDIKAEATPEDELSSKQLGSAIMKAVRRLPMKQKEVFVMKHIKGMKISEIAEILGSAEGTVKSHLFRAVNELQKKLRGFI